jgi:hypothetical protein
MFSAFVVKAALAFRSALPQKSGLLKTPDYRGS